MKIKSLLVSVLLAGSIYAQSDIRRTRFHDATKNIDFTRRYNSFVLAFKSPLCCDNDTIFVSVFSDSINVNTFTFTLYTYFPLNINPINSTMVLEYTDGSDEILYQIGFPNESNYVEYFVATKVYEPIFTKKVKSITFKGIQKFKVKDGKFFIDFYKQIK